jgi:hypothetical protein
VRRETSWVVAAWTLLLVMVSVSVAGAAGGDPGDFAKLPDKARRGTMATDGVFTAGQEETITVAKLLRKVKVSVTFWPGGPECSSIEVVCFDAPAQPAPGARFRTNGRGQATLTFVVPSSYRQFRESDFTEPIVPFTNGQPVTVFASSTHRRRHGRRSKLIWAGAKAQGTIEVPAPPAT